jgi:hypothetical protein
LSDFLSETSFAFFASGPTSIAYNTNRNGTFLTPGTVAMPIKLSPALTEQGIKIETDAGAFWNLCADHMVDEKDKLACIAIGEELKTTYFVLFVQSLLTLTPEEVTGAIMPDEVAMLGPLLD